MSDKLKVKERLVKLVREELSKKKLPSEIVLNKGALIIDPAKFFESHLCIISANEGSVKQAYGSRLTIALLSIGIDIYELKIKAEKQVKSENTA